MQTTEQDTSLERSPERTRPARAAQPLLVFLLIVGGLAIVLYPTAANWFSTRNHNSEITGYTQISEQLPAEERAERLRLADDYNARMPRGPLRDPFSDAPDSQDEEDAAYASYENLLRVSDEGVIGNISYPGRGIYLPLYHGTSDAVLSKGAGHLYGSSLPVGGPSTHSVLTAHSGLANAKLFTPLLDAEVGELFSVEVLGERHFYVVEDLRTVLPNDTRALQVVEGQDYVTLITCTPLGINSHRLLVTGKRVEPPADEKQYLEHEAITAGFPWWLLVLLGSGAGVAAGLVRLGRNAAEQNRGVE